MQADISKIINRIEFEKIVLANKAEFDCKGFSCWAQFIANNSIVLSDQHIEFTNIYAKKSYHGKLRRVMLWDENNKREIVLLTNNFDLCADTISAIYKETWQTKLINS